MCVCVGSEVICTISQCVLKLYCSCRLLQYLSCRSYKAEKRLSKCVRVLFTELSLACSK